MIFIQVILWNIKCGTHNMTFNELNYLRGEDYQLNDTIRIKHPTLQDIINYGEENYLNAINLFCLKPYDLMVELDDMGVDFRKMNDFDLFMQLIQIPMYQEAVKFFIGECNFQVCINPENDEMLLEDIFAEIRIDRYIYGKIAEFIRGINFISDKREFNLENDMALEFVMEEERATRNRRKNMPKKPFESVLANTISFFCWNNLSGYNIENVWNLKVYQFYNGLHRIHKTDNYKNTMLGVYTGNVDSSKIQMDEINWSGKIKL